MKTKLTTILATLILALVSTQAWALEEIIKTYRGVRSLGMGGVVTTTGMYDESLFGGNPATQLEDDAWKIQILSPTIEANTHLISDMSKFSDVKGAQGSDVVTKLINDGIMDRNEHERITNVTGFYSPHFFGDDTSLSFGLLVNEQTNVMLHSTSDVDVQTYLDVGPGAGVAHRFLDGALDVGVNARLIYRAAADTSEPASAFLGDKKISVKDLGGQGGGLDMDIGAFYKVPFQLPLIKLSVGGSLNNLLASKYDMFMKTLVTSIGDRRPPPNDRTGSLGVRVDFPDFMLLNKNLVALEWQDIGDTNHLASFWKKLHIGGETRLIGLLSVRAGFNQGYATAGVGLNLPILKIDVVTYGEELGGVAGELEDRRIAARIAFEI
jgi:hypothetical protein